MRWRPDRRHWVVRDYAGQYVGSYDDRVAALEVAERLERDRARRAGRPHRAEVSSLLADYYAWCDDREDLSNQEGTGDLSNDWHASDDAAVELMHRLASLIR